MSRTVVSLTSVPPRFGGLGPVLESLAAQGADEVQLWLPDRYTRHPGWDGLLPALPAGVTLRRAPEDLGPATKFLPALAELGADDRLIVCDDDMICAPGWLAGLAAASDARPDAAVAVSSYPLARLALAPRPGPGHRVVQGFAGVLIRPGMVQARDIAPRDRLVDDIWLSAQLAASSTPVVTVPELRGFVQPHGAGIAALQDDTTSGLTRAEANLRSATALRAELSIWA